MYETSECIRRFNPKEGTSLLCHAKYEETTHHPRLLDLRWTDCHQRPAWENKNSQQRRRTEHIVDVNHCPPKSRGPLTHWLVTYPELCICIIVFYFVITIVSRIVIGHPRWRCEVATRGNRWLRYFALFSYSLYSFIDFYDPWSWTICG